MFLLEKGKFTQIQEENQVHSNMMKRDEVMKK